MVSAWDAGKKTQNVSHNKFVVLKINALFSSAGKQKNKTIRNRDSDKKSCFFLFLGF